MCQFSSESWPRMTEGWYTPDATREAPKARPVSIVAMLSCPIVCISLKTQRYKCGDYPGIREHFQNPKIPCAMTKMEAPQSIKGIRRGKNKIDGDHTWPGPASMPAIDLENDTIGGPGIRGDVGWSLSRAFASVGRQVAASRGGAGTGNGIISDSTLACSMPILLKIAISEPYSSTVGEIPLRLYLPRGGGLIFRFVPK